MTFDPPYEGFADIAPGDPVFVLIFGSLGDGSLLCSDEEGQLMAVPPSAVRMSFSRAEWVVSTSTGGVEPTIAQSE